TRDSRLKELSLEPPRLITIDGGAHTGKSTAARLLADWLGWNWVSTGAFYRGLARVADLAGVSTDDESRLVELIKHGEFRVQLAAEKTTFLSRGRDITDEIFTPQVGKVTPLISRLALVRESLLRAQRELVN